MDLAEHADEVAFQSARRRRRVDMLDRERHPLRPNPISRSHSMRSAWIALALTVSAVPALALQSPAAAPSAPQAAIKAGTYKTDPAHTQLAWTINHLGISLYHGLFGDIEGTLSIDPAKPEAAKVSVTIPIAKVVTTSEDLNKHLLTADFFDVATYPTARFESTAVEVEGTTAKITGNLTLHGVTKPVVLDAKLTGSGEHPMSKALNIGFDAVTQIKRSEFGMSKYVPMLGDDVDLRITAAFERTG
jgi:polyisoprenoid-binding protein YceI